MAAQLMLVKSKLLLPRTEVAEDADPAEEQGDPRAELVRRLLEYQKYRAAAEELGRHDILDRDVFTRRARVARLPQPDGPEGLAEVSVFQLIEALDKALANVDARVARTRWRPTGSPSPTPSAGSRRSSGSGAGSPSWSCCSPPEGPARSAIIAAFLAILEMAKLRLLRVVQAPAGADGADGEILVEARDTLGDVVAGNGRAGGVPMSENQGPGPTRRGAAGAPGGRGGQGGPVPRRGRAGRHRGGGGRPPSGRSPSRSSPRRPASSPRRGPGPWSRRSSSSPRSPSPWRRSGSPPASSRRASARPSTRSPATSARASPGSCSTRWPGGGSFAPRPTPPTSPAVSSG